MLQSSTVDFLSTLAKNNNKTWFDEHRVQYAAAKENFESIVAQVLLSLAETEPLFKEQKAKDCIFRIFRDVRFSKDKTPYKAHFGAFFSKGGRKSNGAGYYLHLEPGGKSFAGGGLWEPESAILKAVRQEIDYNFGVFKKIIDNRKFASLFGKLQGGQLRTLPQGYTADNPAIELLKMKGFVVMHSIPDDKMSGNALTKKTAEVFTTMKPFIDFLNGALD